MREGGCRFRLGRWLPGVLLGGGEERFLVEQSADAVEADFGGRVEPAEGAHAGEVAGQDVLEETAEPLVGFQGQGGELAGLAVAVRPVQAAVGQLLDEAVAGGGFEDVTGEVTQGIFSGAGGLSADVPRGVPDAGRDLAQQIRMVFLEARFEEGATVIAQGAMVQEELFGGDPVTAIGAEAAAGDEVMDVGMKDQSAAPSVAHAEHPQLGAEAFGVLGQILEGLRTGAKQQVQSDLQMGADEQPQRFRHREGNQEIRGGQQEPLALAGQPGVGVGLAAERAMPVVAGMVAVVKAVTVGAGEECSAAGRGATGADGIQDLSLPGRQGGAETPEVIRRQTPEPLMDGEALATGGGGGGAHRSPMNWSRRFWCWVWQRLVRWV